MFIESIIVNLRIGGGAASCSCRGSDHDASTLFGLVGIPLMLLLLTFVRFYQSFHKSRFHVRVGASFSTLFLYFGSAYALFSTFAFSTFSRTPTCFLHIDTFFPLIHTFFLILTIACFFFCFDNFLYNFFH